MHISMGENGPVVNGLSEENVIIFFGKLNEECGYGVIFGPPDTCLPTEGSTELWNAFVALGLLDEEMKIYNVKHGHKYSTGGGFVEFDGTCSMDRKQIFFRLQKNQCSYEGRPIEELYEVR